MKLKITFTTVALALLSSAAVAQTEFTGSVEIRSIETLSGSEQTFIRSSGGGWGHPNCAAAEFVNLSPNSTESYTEQLAIALTARAAGITVTARGDCSPNGQVVVAERLRLD